MKKVKQAVITAVCVSFGSQLYINVFSDDFIIAVAVIIFGTCLHIFPEINPIKLAVLTGLCSPFFRYMMLYLQIKDAAAAAEAALPDILFYFSYGFIYYFAYYRKSNQNYTIFLFTLVACDTISNTVELLAMNGPGFITYSLVQTLFVIALVRSALVFMTCIAIDSYKSLLSKEEHELRYKKLMVMASVFDSEVYFMKKNIGEIEDVMKKAFSLYHIAEDKTYPREIHTLALDIAKDVHEIKKGYIRVIKGIQDNIVSEMKVMDLCIRDLIQILESDIAEYINEKNKAIHFSARIDCNFTVKEHYRLMSVLRNLIVNGIDAVAAQQNGLVELHIYKTNREENEFYAFKITDNGIGIKQEDMEMIFAPGYSTKFDLTTGDINRGIGLTLVRDLIVEVFGGSISVESVENRYSQFLVWIPVSYFEEDKVEILYCG
ncbi:sensor histidine kinase [Clostridium aminobutyricum]|uniref:histidine kinase n=1 Tax=Clostridium aminobutyricum TaxID=33953 RepID=A0A939DA04_CLOAM|nr:ATP-binding protein [Clostridium aminobutyricum]MBN7773797.1 ATP-binding protein [Clostridium aminobutyricum]